MATKNEVTQLRQEIKKLKTAMVTRAELRQFLGTVEVLSNPDTMKQLAASDEDIRNGRVQEVRTVRDLL